MILDGDPQWLYANNERVSSASNRQPGSPGATHEGELTNIRRGEILNRFVYKLHVEWKMTEAGRVYKELKQDVITCVLSPGLSVSEAELSGRYQASRTPIREACRKLSEEGLIQIIPFRGYTITPLTIEEYRNLYEVQANLDPMIAALAAERGTPEQIKEIELWASYEYHAGQKSSYYTFLEWNKQFHIAIAAATQNQVLMEIASNMQVRLMRYFFLVIIMDSYGAQLVKEHRELVKAIRSGNAQKARERAAEHVTNTINRTAAVDMRTASLPVSSSQGAPNWLYRAGYAPAKAIRRSQKTAKPKLTCV